MATLEQNRNFFYEVFSDSQGKFNTNQHLDRVIEWMQQNMQPHEVFPYSEHGYRHGYIDGYQDGEEGNDYNPLYK